MTDQPSPNRRGRPPRAQASAKALAGLVINPTTFDPLKVLVEIAADTSAPAAARVSAAKALLADRERGEGADAGYAADLNRRAVALMKRRVAN
jgi:hypothetical protein